MLKFCERPVLNSCSGVSVLEEAWTDMTMDNNCNIPIPPLKNEGHFANGSPTTVPLSQMGPQKELCAGCQRPIEDRFLLRVMENSWHEHCLLCSVCQEPLTRSCYVKDRKLFCKMDYDKYFGTKCTGCLQTIPANELVMRALGNVYHLRCFICVACGHQLQKGDQFVVKDSQLFCRLDFEKEYAMMTMSPKNDWCTSFSPKSDDELSSLDENDLDQQSKGPKRPRTILTTSQRRKFKASFEINPKPCRKVRETLASETGLSVRVVQVWFQNQRAKVKKLARRQSSDNGDNNNKKNNNNNNNNKQNKRKKEDEENTDGSSVQSDTTLQSIPPLPENNQQFSNQLRPFDNPNSQGSMYPSQDIYDNNMDLETIDTVLMGENAPPTTNSNQGNVLNPIDKLYSMQSSYFSAE